MAVLEGAFNEIPKAQDPSKDSDYILGSVGLGQSFFGDMRIGDRTGGAVKVNGTQGNITVQVGATDQVLIGKF